MGAWGHRGFENDSALDWLDELRGIASLRKALTRATGRRTLDVDDASATIAAAEIVAAARGHAAKSLPDEVTDWLATHGDKIVAADAVLARKAVACVAAASETKDLWAEAGGAKNPWTREVAKLLERLARPIAKRKRPVSKKPPRKTAAQIMADMQYTTVRSPDGTLEASATSYHGLITLGISAAGGGGTIAFTQNAQLETIELRWIDDGTLEVLYPATATLEKRDPSWFFYGRTVACRYTAV